MKEFSPYISEKWNIPEPISKELCESFEKGDSPYYLADYRPSITAEVDITQLWGVFDFLKGAAALSSQKKRLVNALKKSNKLTEQLQKKITLCINPFELDDMLISERPNPRSKAQIALKKGLGALADKIQGQEEEAATLDDLIAPFIGGNESLKTAEDVVAGVKDILAERFAYDETARTMVREFAYDDGFFEVQPKNKKDPEFSRFSGKPVPLREMTKEDPLMLLCAEDKKTVRLKLGVQLFRIGELLKQHFITNPDFVGFDLICQAIDDCWLRLLQPIVERDVKVRLRKESEDWAHAEISRSFSAQLQSNKNEGPFLSFGMFDDKNIALVAFNADGRLLGASLEKKHSPDKPAISERLKQFYSRYKPVRIIVPDNEAGMVMEESVRLSIDPRGTPVEIARCKFTDTALELSKSDWMKQHFWDLDESMRRAFAMGLFQVQPLGLIPKIGIQYFTLHPLQPYVSVDRLSEMVSRMLSEILLHDGIPINDADGAALHLLPTLPESMIKELLSRGSKRSFSSKNDLLKMPGMTEAIFRNIAGYIIIPYSENPLDRTLVHPDHFSWVSEMSGQLSISPDAVIANPESLREFAEQDVAKKFYIENRLMAQLEAGQRYNAPAFSKHRRKFKLDELQEGTIVSGHVTNITPFGVFVNINAVCEGLIHISQLADTYVETPEQVVSLHDAVNVRIIRIDPKKRRISLSMKGLTSQPIKVSPSKRQLSSLANHFQNR
jgi:uncharacterized protein